MAISKELRLSKSLELSFEFFPPKTEDMEAKMWTAIEELALLNPVFMSVTYGAGGGVRDNTNRIAQEIIRRTHIAPAAHLTCIRTTRTEVDRIAREHWNSGVRHIVALRGDPPKNDSERVPETQRYAYATDLIRGLHLIGDFEISVAAFPEKHPESTSFEQDIEILRMKADLGASRAITQYFFDNQYFLRLRDRATKAGITMPIIPGIIPINHFANIKKFSAMCKTSIPEAMEAKFAPLDNTPEARDVAAIELATSQCRALMKEGITRFHFYTMNRSDLITAVCNNLGVKQLMQQL